MANKVTNFNNSISLRDFLDQKITDIDESNEEYFLVAKHYFGTGESPINLEKLIRNIQLIWAGDIFFIEGDVETDDPFIDEHFLVPFNLFSWGYQESDKDNTAKLIISPDNDNDNIIITFSDKKYNFDDYIDTIGPIEDDDDFVGWSPDENGSSNIIGKLENLEPYTQKYHVLYLIKDNS